MTGAALPSSTDTVVPYEDVDMADGIATVTADTILARQNIHFGEKIKSRTRFLSGPAVITPAAITAAAAVGKANLSVKKNPRTIIISTGDELVDIGDAPPPSR